MITILWLIRSFQPIMKGDTVNSWQHDWFLSLIITLLFLCGDTMIIRFFQII